MDFKVLIADSALVLAARQDEHRVRTVGVARFVGLR
jgi:hypothetical protein